MLRPPAAVVKRPEYNGRQMRVLSAFLLASAAVNASATSSPWTDRRPLAVSGVRVFTSFPAANRTVELRVDVAATYDNPFDPRQVAVDAEVRGPGETRFTQPAFWYVPCGRTADGTDATRSGTGEWRVRFLPPRAGRWTVTVGARDRTGTKRSAPHAVEVAPSEAPGVIGVSPRDARYFEHATGEPYFPVGLNVCWSERKGLKDYDE
ncbi:MAG: DUF5060 domain-containing protein, partial [bacterium]